MANKRKKQQSDEEIFSIEIDEKKNIENGEKSDSKKRNLKAKDDRDAGTSSNQKNIYWPCNPKYNYLLSMLNQKSKNSPKMDEQEQTDNTSIHNIDQGYKTSKFAASEKSDEPLVSPLSFNKDYIEHQCKKPASESFTSNEDQGRQTDMKLFSCILGCNYPCEKLIQYNDRVLNWLYLGDLNYIDNIRTVEDYKEMHDLASKEENPMIFYMLSKSYKRIEKCFDSYGSLDHIIKKQFVPYYICWKLFEKNVTKIKGPQHVYSNWIPYSEIMFKDAFSETKQVIESTIKRNIEHFESLEKLDERSQEFNWSQSHVPMTKQTEVAGSNLKSSNNSNKLNKPLTSDFENRLSLYNGHGCPCEEMERYEHKMFTMLLTEKLNFSNNIQLAGNYEQLHNLAFEEGDPKVYYMVQKDYLILQEFLEDEWLTASTIPLAKYKLGIYLTWRQILKTLSKFEEFKNMETCYINLTLSRAIHEVKTWLPIITIEEAQFKASIYASPFNRFYQSFSVFQIKESDLGDNRLTSYVEHNCPCDEMINYQQRAVNLLLAGKISYYHFKPAVNFKDLHNMASKELNPLIFYTFSKVYLWLEALTNSEGKLDQNHISEFKTLLICSDLQLHVSRLENYHNMLARRTADIDGELIKQYLRRK